MFFHSDHIVPTEVFHQLGHYPDLNQSKLAEISTNICIWS